MAINVNTVYQTVLLILNKEQRGYMTPLEFNKTGQQSQLEIFENYFDSLNQQIRIPQTDTDYADRVASIDEKMSIFKEYGNATSISSSNVFSLPDPYSGTSSASQAFTANPISQVFTITNTNVLALSNANGISNVFLRGIELASTLYTLNGATLTLSTPVALNDVITINMYPKQFYKLGGLFYTNGAIPAQELERVGRSELYHLLSSNLTKPTTSYPIFVYENNTITVAPTTITSGITTSYIRKPLPPIWNFSQDPTTGQYIFVADTSYNFELHPADQTELILKILLYAGVVIKDPQIIQVAAQQVAQENQNQQR